MKYSEKVMDHFTNPRNVGEIENADGVGVVGNAKCGDIMKMYLKIGQYWKRACKFEWLVLIRWNDEGYNTLFS